MTENFAEKTPQNNRKVPQNQTANQEVEESLKELDQAGKRAMALFFRLLALLFSVEALLFFVGAGVLAGAGYLIFRVAVFVRQNLDTILIFFIVTIIFVLLLVGVRQFFIDMRTRVEFDDEIDTGQMQQTKTDITIVNNIDTSGQKDVTIINNFK